jgi:exodeoxyribonuclease VII small subunit
MAKRQGKKTPEAETAPGFETLLDETEALVEELESGELGLDEALRKYEKGLANLKRCGELIARAEEKVRVLVESSEADFRLEALDADDEDDNGDDETDGD